MLNFLKFRAKAQYSDGRETDLTGEQAFDIYIETMRKIVERGGGKFLFDSAVKYLTIGEVEGLWDRAALVQYPSAAEFLKITSSPEAAAIRTHRSAGLEGQLLILRLAAIPLRGLAQVMARSFFADRGVIRRGSIIRAAPRWTISFPLGETDWN